uniref:Uncharacterized protein n=1 Tax=Sphaerodactylus townsendi TaxID=933632 RepID=A0ACB8GF01_9SAUR
MDYKQVMKVVTEEIGLSTIHGTTREAMERGSSESESSARGARACLPATKEDVDLVNLDASHPRLPSIDTGEDEELDEPNPPRASSSRQGDVEAPDGDLDAFTLHAQHENGNRPMKP